MNIGEKIKYLRCALGFTQEELALSANTTKQTIHKYETGIISNIPASKVKAIADKLNSTPAYLMGWEKQPHTMIGNTNKITVYAMNGEKSVDSIVVNEDTMEEIAELVSIANQLPKEKVQALINTANAMK